ncbi:HAD family hydrolase [Streptomyces sp. DH37]|uniref:HAD family hydrolase n=1 Tax=Streptomyces sp. DH37 TaxID=3040122 RepID=UPI0024434D9C|nr:HAD family hydrolase [Streptomyces sp. DH37]MDG9701985.1 HAD hydrolase-like protein [Streptomyces sp. DH37]
MTNPRTGQCLFIDGDDTLWENNIYFEHAIEEFIDLVRHESVTRAELRHVLDEIERANCKVHGYGARSFVRSLHDCYEHVHGREAPDDHMRAIAALGERILHQAPVLIPGVHETLSYLSERHRLVLLTKGDHEEQAAKVERSRLGSLFEEVVIVPEKTAETYVSVVEKVDVPTARTWMIGNSPRSDILPALAAGLGAVYVPHPDTWVLEKDAVPEPSDRVLHVERFADLAEHF